MRHYDLARAEIGTKEWEKGHNPVVVQYFADVGHAWVKDDETAWCAAFVGSMLQRAGLPHTGKLNARSYLDWGNPVAPEDARPGDVVVFSRGNPNGWKGHVGFYVRDSGPNLLILSGNQQDSVCEKPYSTARLLGIRRLDYPEAPLADEIPEVRHPLKAFLSALFPRWFQ